MRKLRGLSVQAELHESKWQQDAFGIAQVQRAAGREPGEHYDRLRQTAEDEQEHPVGGGIRCAEAGSRLQKIPMQGQQKHQNGVPFAGDFLQHKEAFCKGFPKPLRSFTF